MTNLISKIVNKMSKTERKERAERVSVGFEPKTFDFEKYSKELKLDKVSMALVAGPKTFDFEKYSKELKLDK